MRIISGSRKGHVIRAPKSLPIRPTTDISKEGLFNILVNRYDLEECSVLDLFSGSGSISMEFASRGAKRILAVDKHPGCTNFLKAEAGKLGLGQIEAIRADVMVFIRNCPETFDIIFCDPPYAWKEYEKMILGIQDNQLLNAGGVMIVEHHSVNRFSHLPHFEHERAYGQNLMTFYGSGRIENSAE